MTKFDLHKARCGKVSDVAYLVRYRNNERKLSVRQKLQKWGGHG